MDLQSGKTLFHIDEFVKKFSETIKKEMKELSKTNSFEFKALFQEKRS